LDFPSSGGSRIGALCSTGSTSLILSPLTRGNLRCADGNFIQRYRAIAIFLTHDA
jgi:hypothetical protein